MAIRILLILLLSVSAYGADFSFGFAGDAGNNGVSLENIQRGGEYVCDTTGTLDSMEIYCQVATANAKIKGAVYHISGSDTTLIDTTEELTVTAPTEAYVWFDFLINATVTNGETYLLTVWGEDAGGVNSMYWGAETDRTYQYETVTYGAWQDPWSGAATGPIDRGLKIIAYGHTASEPTGESFSRHGGTIHGSSIH